VWFAVQSPKQVSPFSGDWVANIAKSKGHPNHLSNKGMEPNDA
jgi:hypothetical protein